MDAAKKEDLLHKHAKKKKYKTMDAAKKMLEKRRQKYFSNKNKNVESCTEMFKKKLKGGILYVVCVIEHCIRNLVSNNFEIFTLLKDDLCSV